MNYNKAIIVGHLTKKPEVKALPSGQSVANFSVATNRFYTDKDGSKQEQAEFHNVVVFGKTADTCGQYLEKGQNVLIEGRLQTRSWEKDGEKRYTTEIVADNVQFGKKTEQSTNQPVESDGSSDEKAIDYPEDDINPEDIPF